MPRPRKPTVLLERKGAFRKDPQRKRTDPEVVGEIGSPPDYFTNDEKTVWNEIATTAPVGVLSSADRGAVEAAARYWAKFRKTPAEDLTAAMVQQLRSILGCLGMTPADRSKVSAPERKPENPFSKFAERK